MLLWVTACRSMQLCTFKLALNAPIFTSNMIRLNPLSGLTCSVQNTGAVGVLPSKSSSSDAQQPQENWISVSGPDLGASRSVQSCSPSSYKQASSSSLSPKVTSIVGPQHECPKRSSSGKSVLPPALLQRVTDTVREQQTERDVSTTIHTDVTSSGTQCKQSESVSPGRPIKTNSRIKKTSVASAIENSAKSTSVNQEVSSGSIRIDSALSGMAKHQPSKQVSEQSYHSTSGVHIDDVCKTLSNRREEKIESNLKDVADTQSLNLPVDAFPVTQGLFVEEGQHVTMDDKTMQPQEDDKVASQISCK